MIDHIELTLAKLADPGASSRGSKENLSLEQICSIAAEEGKVLCKELTGSMVRYRRLCKAIEIHRNKHIAHFDYSTCIDPKVPGLPAITTTTIKSAMMELDQFMNQVSEILGEKIETDILRLETEYCFDPVMSDNVDALVCFLAFGLRYEELPSSPLRIVEEEIRPLPAKGWAAMIRKAYEVDPMTCPKCGGRMKVVTFITEYAVVDRIIDHLKLTFVAEKPPPPAWGFRDLDMVADPPAEYFS